MLNKLEKPQSRSPEVAPGNSSQENEVNDEVLQKLVEQKSKEAIEVTAKEGTIPIAIRVDDLKKELEGQYGAKEDEDMPASTESKRDTTLAEETILEKGGDDKTQEATTQEVMQKIVDKYREQVQEKIRALAPEYLDRIKRIKEGAGDYAKLSEKRKGLIVQMAKRSWHTAALREAKDFRQEMAASMKEQGYTKSDLADLLENLKPILRESAKELIDQELLRQEAGAPLWSETEVGASESIDNGEAGEAKAEQEDEEVDLSLEPEEGENTPESTEGGEVKEAKEGAGVPEVIESSEATEVEEAQESSGEPVQTEEEPGLWEQVKDDWEDVASQVRNLPGIKQAGDWLEKHPAVAKVAKFSGKMAASGVAGGVAGSVFLGGFWVAAAGGAAVYGVKKIGDWTVQQMGEKDLWSATKNAVAEGWQQDKDQLQREGDFVAKKKGWWAKTKAALGFISDRERIDEYEGRRNNKGE